MNLGQDVMFQPVYSGPLSRASAFLTRARRRKIIIEMLMEDNFFGLYDSPETVQAMRDMDTAYGSCAAPDTDQQRFGMGVPADGYRQNRYAAEVWGAGGNSSRRHNWAKSTAWEYWIPNCLAEPALRFEKYFRVQRDRFDMIYEAAALSGEFGLNPEEPMYSRVHPDGPSRPGHHQDPKKIPLCLLIAASLRHVASGDTFDSLAQEFHIGRSTLNAHDNKFWKWFRKEYWSTWVVGASGVGFDNLASIEKEEKLFRQMGLPGFITCMDGVHFAWEGAPFQYRWRYIGKEGYPTIVVNLHCTATGCIKYATTIFAGATNDKTIVRSDELVNKMRTDPLFLDRRWATAALDSAGAPHVLTGCMTLNDGGYHHWLETMSGYSIPTNPMEARWSARYAAARFASDECCSNC